MLHVCLKTPFSVYTHSNLKDRFPTESEKFCLVYGPREDCNTATALLIKVEGKICHPTTQHKVVTCVTYGTLWVCCDCCFTLTELILLYLGPH